MRRAFVLLVVLVALAVVGACRAPTQVTVSVIYRGPLPCTTLPQIAIAVRVSPDDAEKDLSQSVYTAQTSSCEPDGDVGRFGTLVVIPGSSSTASIAVVGALTRASPSLTISDCTREKSFANCIVARRQISFSNHVSLELPIELDFDCASVACDARSTCRSRQCVPSDAACTDDTCDIAGGSDGAALDGGDGPATDGAIESGDGAALDVDASDATTPTCQGSAAGPGTFNCPGRVSCDGAGRICCYSPTSSKWVCDGSCGGFTTKCITSTDCPLGQLCCHGDGVSGASCAVAENGVCPVQAPSMKSYETCTPDCPCTNGGNCTPLGGPGFGECKK